MIIIQVSAKLDGLGDFVFCLKLAEFLNSISEYNNDIYIVTTNERAEERLGTLYNPDDYPGIHVLTKQEYKEMFHDRVDSAAEIAGDLPSEDIKDVATVRAYIKAPALTRNSKEKLSLPSNHDCKIIVISEYGFSKKEYPFTQYLLDDEDPREVVLIDSGFGEAEKGILISEKLASISNPNVTLTEKLELETAFKAQLSKGGSTLLNRIFGNADPSIHEYHQSSELSIAYFNKEGSDCRFNYLNMLTQVYNPQKNQDIVMMGGHSDEPIPNFEELKGKLLSDGFTKILFIDSRGQETMLYPDSIQIDIPQTHAQSEEKLFRLISIPPTTTTPKQTEALLGLSNGRLCGTTGDQSFGEAISARKIPFYQVRKHKEEFAKDFITQVNKERDDELSSVLSYCVSTEKDRASQILPGRVSSTFLEKWDSLCSNIHTRQDLGQNIYMQIHGEKLVHSSSAAPSIEVTQRLRKSVKDIKSSAQASAEEQQPEKKRPGGPSGCGCIIS